MSEIEEKITKQSRRSYLSQLVHAKSDKETIGAWKLDLIKTLHIFNVRSVGSVSLSLTPLSQTQLIVNTNAMVSDIYHNVVAGQGGTYCHFRSVSAASYH